MGNSSGKESREASRPSSIRPPLSPGSIPASQSSPTFPFDRPTFIRGPGGGLLAIGGGNADGDSANPEVRKETKQEREARKLEKERAVRLKERERSLREEGVDGGYLVTLGTYVGPEDFSKSIVRQLQIERRLAPFWRGLDEHSSSWTEHQLVAAARGLPIPAADEIPPEFASPDLDADSQNNTKSSPGGSVSIPIRQAPRRLQTDTLSSSQPTPLNQSDSPISPSSGPSPLFRGRAKTLASLTSSKNSSQVDITPQEIQLPKEPQINGQPVEAYLYKDATECPICFLYYPPYLNKTRCCDQSICSECFVQIKRPDPHPPEHNDPNEPLPAEPRPAEEEGQLISEPSQCPFCVQPEFGVTYEPPPFRRGLAYANQGTQSSFGRMASAMSSSSSLSTSTPGNASPVARRRTHSLSATAPTVITTDRVRPDWAKKLSDARAHAARRSAAATALHTAAYMMPSGYGGFHLGRRRRQNLSVDSAQQQGSGDRDRGGYLGNMDFLFAALEGQGSSRRPPQGNSDLFPGRISSRGTRADDLEEMMMMEAIRQSLAAEEERKKKEEKESSKQSKKDEKKQAKEQKKADKEAKRTGSYSAESPVNSFYTNGETSTFNTETSIEDGKGKGRATGQTPAQNRAAYIGFDPLNEPTSTLNTEASNSSHEDPQKHLEGRRTQLDQVLQQAGSGFARARGISDASSSGSSYIESSNASGSHLPQDGSSGESGLNFGSLAAIVDKDGETPAHEQHDASKQSQADSGAITGPKESIPLAQTESNPYDQKHYGDITLLEGSSERQTTQ